MFVIQMDDIRLPMRKGSMEDITQEDGQSSQQDSSELDSMSTQGAKKLYERESQIVIDYTKLDDDYKDVSNHSNRKMYSTEYRIVK